MNATAVKTHPDYFLQTTVTDMATSELGIQIIAFMPSVAELFFIKKDFEPLKGNGKTEIASTDFVSVIDEIDGLH